MKRLLIGKVFFGLFGDHREDDFFRQAQAKTEVQPDVLRWFGGMHDLDYTYICQAL